MDLSEIGGEQWEGWTLGKDGLLYAPEWRGGLHPAEIRAIPYLYASQAENKRLGRELDQMKKNLEATARLAGWYRRQLQRESQLGLALSRIL